MRTSYSKAVEIDGTPALAVIDLVDLDGQRGALRCGPGMGFDPDYLMTRIVVPKAKRNQGIASGMLRALVADADAEHKSIVLALSPYDETVNLKRLTKLFAGFGFQVDPINKSCMYRAPTEV